MGSLGTKTKSALSFLNGMQGMRIDVYAGSASYSFLVSLIPLLVVAGSLLPFTSLTKEGLTKILSDLVPSMGSDFLASLIDRVFSQSTGILSFSLVIAVFSAARGVLSIRQGLDYVLGVRKKKNFIVLRLISIVYTLALMVIFLILFVFMILEGFFQSNIEARLPAIGPVLFIFYRFHNVVVIAVLTLFFMLMFAFLPGEKQKFKKQFFGALVTAVSWIVLANLVSYFVDRFYNLSVYGSLAAPVLVMIWYYLCMNMLFFGAYINRYLNER